ncbi:hypothetical protein N7474_002320 [Penicillium riverlandense]|uniref:uncharacterized protein n=1 Tax=Penicillium riverlandense TaxID=1903569 RepID=UPI002548EF78|nr:uncharacterized protein N7474_002320 [Penicillium riverlandense]KAJ5825182.1 hypothetical protein N7474_002320 [Penicillium riverlandense]
MLHKTLSYQQSSSETIENEVMCMHLARCIIEDFSNVPEEHPKYTFPFLHYLTGATIIALGLIIKQPAFKHAYGDLTLEAARSLENHCQMTWVSGRMARAVLKLNQMATATLGTVTQASLPRAESHHNMVFDPPGSSVLNGARFRSISERPDQEMSKPAAEERNPEAVVQRLMSFAEESQYSRITRESGHRNPKIGSHHIEDSLTASDALDNNQERNSSTRQAPPCGYNGGYNAALPSIGGIVDASPIGSRRVDTLATTVPAHIMSDTRVSTPYPNAWLPGEMIGGGTEWLQTLFTSDLDTYIPPAWD